MKNKKIKNSFIIILIVGFTVMVSLGFMGDDKTGKKKTLSKVYKTVSTTQSGKQGDAYRLFINNINLPLNRTGVIADVNIPGPSAAESGAGGKFQQKVFLYSSGFFLSGYANGKMFANAVASASLVQDYVQGTVEGGQTDPNAVIYVLKATDPPFSQSWQDWADAVALGADYYDGNRNGIYDPVDLNGNGIWDRESFSVAGDGEDSPDLLGDETVWCVYHDGIPGPQRRWNAVDPLGIEIRQTVFALNSKGSVGNIVFVRYRIKYVGLGNPNEADKLEDVYFGVWADPDLGDHTDDRVGSDILRNAGYTYNADNDDAGGYGNQAPAFFIDFFQGPIEYIPGETFTDTNGNGVYDDGVDIPLDTAYSTRGRRISPEGVVEFPGARNQPLSSFVLYINGEADLRDPDNHEEARNYITGKTRTGLTPDPCTFAFGEVLGGIDCSTVDPNFQFSGDPVTNTGWISNISEDVRQMSNTGPFTLRKGEEKEIVVAYVVGQGENNINSITVAREYDDIAQQIFDANFPAPPAPDPLVYNVETGADFIDITFETSNPTSSNTYGVNYRAVDTVLDIDRRMQGFYITAYRTPVKIDFINGVTNSIELANYSIDNIVENIYGIVSNGGQDLKRAKATEGRLLDSALYADPKTGRIRLRVTQDPFTGGPLIKGKEYYFLLTQYTLNHNAIVHRDSFNVNNTQFYGTKGDYLDLGGNAFEEFESPVITVTFGKDMYSPAIGNQGSVKLSGSSDGDVKYLVVNPDELTGDEYKVEFFRDKNQSANEIYNPFWRLTNTRTGEILIDSSKIYNFDTTSFAGLVTEGFVTKIKPLVPSYNVSYTYTPAENIWYKPFPDTSVAASQGRGVFYVGRDIPQGTNIGLFGNTNTRSNAISADKLRDIQIRFGQTSKAYRYLNGFVGNPITRGNSYRYAAGITPADTVGKGTIGNWDAVNDRPNGFVDVPFSAYAIDKDGNERRLAVGFIERSSSGGQFLGNPEGVWNPDTSFNNSREAIIIFASDYSETPKIEYTGGDFNTTSGTTTVWADLLKIQPSEVPADAQGITEEQRRIFNSPWFDAMYVVNFERTNSTNFYMSGDVFEIPMNVTPYSDKDVFTFQTRAGGSLTESERKALFDKVNVFPNPLYGYNTANYNNPQDEPYVTFSNLPEDVTIKIFTLSGTLIRTLTTEDKTGGPTSPFLNWDLENENGLRVASGLYLAIVSSPNYGEKILKFSIIMPQKQLQRY